MPSQKLISYSKQPEPDRKQNTSTHSNDFTNASEYTRLDTSLTERLVSSSTRWSTPRITRCAGSSSPTPAFDIGIINGDRIARTMRTILNRRQASTLYWPEDALANSHSIDDEVGDNRSATPDSEGSHDDRPPSHTGYAPTSDEYDFVSSSEDSVSSRSTSPEYNEPINPTIGSPSVSSENDDQGLSLVGDSFNLPAVDLENNDIAQIPSPNHKLAENQPTTPGADLYSGSPSPFTPFPHHKTAGRRRR